MARFERRKAPQQKQQPIGSIYSRSVNVNSQQNINQMNQINQMLTVIKKHDNLITKLLKRFNDFESTVQVKIESLIDAKIREEMDALQAIKNSNHENNTVDQINNNQTNEVVDNKKVIQNTDMELLMEHLKQIKSSMLIKDDLQKEIDSMKQQLQDINKSNIEQYQQFSEEQVRNLSKWMSDMASIEKNEVVIEQYKEIKENAFDDKSETPKNELEKKVVKEVDLEIKTIKKNNVKLEINETDKTKETV